jgi:hypothetical protein
MTSDSESTSGWKDQEALRAELVPLLQAKRYEDALSLLYRARTMWPHDEELSVSIEQVKGFLIIKYARKLGGLDRVAPPLPASVARTPEVMLLARYINGYSSFDDLAQVSPLGRLRTLQVLVSLYTESTPPPIDAEPSSGLRLPGDQRPASNTRLKSEPEDPPDTARSAALHSVSANAGVSRSVSVTQNSPAPELASIFQPPPDAGYQQKYAEGTKAFVQKRYAEAVEAFETCVQLRPSDQSAAVMLKRSLSELKLLR